MDDGRNNDGEMNGRKSDFFKTAVFYLLAFMATFIIFLNLLNSAIWSVLRRK
jgi:hypothetical protein